MKKKITAILLTLCMALSLLPLSALAAAWKVTLNGKEITLNVDDSSGAVTCDDQDANQYYTFKKVQDQDTFQYYTLQGVYCGELTGTPVVLEDECICDTKCTADDVNQDCPVCSAEGAVLDDVCKGTASEVQGDTVTAEAPVENGKAEATVEVSQEQAAGMVEAADDGAVKVKVETTNATTVAVTLPEALITAAKNAESVTTVEITTEIATVALPAADLSTSVKTLTVTKMTATTTVKAGVSLTLGGKTGNFSAPVAVTLKVESSVTTGMKNPCVAYQKGSIWERVNSFFKDGAFTFHTRHFSDFAVMESSASKPQAIAAQTSGEYTLPVEANESLVALIEAKSGKAYIASNATADAPEDDLRSATVSAPAADTDNVWVVIGKAQRTSVMGVDMIKTENGQASILAALNVD